MKRITQLGAFAATLLLCAAGNPIHVLAVGEQQKNLMIVEVSPESRSSASDEYILIHNPNDTEVDVAGLMIQYRSASYKSDDIKGWSTRAIFGCESNKSTECATLTEVKIAPGGIVRLSSYESDPNFLPLAAGMATTGGVVRLVRPAEGDSLIVIHDKVGYGAAADFEGDAAAPAPTAGRSIIRQQSEDGVYTDTDQNGVDLVLQPQDEPVPTEPPAPMPDTPSLEGSSTGYLDVEVSEVLPDPASPQTDSADEFIELYNPHAESVNLSGYVLKTGTNWNYKYVLSDITLAPYEYLTLSAAQTHLTLSNSGSGVRLYDPAGKVIFEVPSFGKAKPGQSWIRDAQGQWVWTGKVTPDAQNTVEVVITPPKQTVSATKKSTSTKATSPKKAATPKTSAVKGATTVATTPPAQDSSGGNQAGMWALGVAAALGLGYALFEYRSDIATFARRRWQALSGLFRK